MLPIAVRKVASVSFVTSLLFVAMLFATGCAEKKAQKGSAKHYQLTGKVLSLNSKDQTASIDAAAIPDYMNAMTMSYPIAEKSEFESLHPGDQIRATVNVYDSGDYDLSAIQKAGK